MNTAISRPPVPAPQPVIKICDEMMGVGKTTAVINMMNAAPDAHYIYVTPLLDEDLRIAKACPALKFARPGFVGLTKRRTPGTKSEDLIKLLTKRRNIATTHALFDLFTPEAYELARQCGYTLIIDEEPALVSRCKYRAGDFRLLEKLGCIQRHDDGTFDVKDDGDNHSLNGLLKLIRTRRLMTISDKDAPTIMWCIDSELFTSFREIYVLTYMFQGSVLSYYLQMHRLPVQMIYVERHGDQIGGFVNTRCYFPEIAAHLSNVIHICEREDLNAPGDKTDALSVSWHRTNTWHNTKAAKALKAAMRCYYEEETRFIYGRQRMWTVYSDFKEYYKRNGWTAGLTPFNLRGTNKYAACRSLAYLCNVHMHPDLKNLMKHHGVEIDEKQHATSMLVQWIWRSAIRNGEEIWLYLPSSRMRQFLKEWMAHVAQEYAQFMDSKQSISIVGGSDHE